MNNRDDERLLCLKDEITELPSRRNHINTNPAIWGPVPWQTMHRVAMESATPIDRDTRGFYYFIELSIERGLISIIQKLLDGYTFDYDKLLALAIKHNQPEIAQMMLEKGADASLLGTPIKLD